MIETPINLTRNIIIGLFLAIPPMPDIGFFIAIPPIFILGVDFCVAGLDAPHLALFIFIDSFPVYKLAGIFIGFRSVFVFKVFCITSED
jgi:hypothetical protein